MNTLWTLLGRTIFWLAWPLFWVYLPMSERTRVLIIHAGKILVVKGWIGSRKWGLPGGGLHRGESPLDGSLREVEEETGIRLAGSQITPLLFSRYHNIGLHFYCHYFEVTFTKLPATRKQMFEINELQWIDRKSLNVDNAGADVLMALNVYDKKT